MTTIKAIIFDFGRVISAQKPQSLFASYEVFLNLAPNTLNTIMFDSPLWEKALVGELKMSEYWQDIGSHLNLHNLEEVTA
ncbi:MAG: hypothetical protein GY702_10510, partial [Desulfobulbaceae bacterium]|nr:hypothetical protein [Desulfobulbaceae bacterium]